MTTSIPIHPANFTRRSACFIQKFRRERRHYLIPLYWMLRMSDLAREGMERSGSYRFADHIYRCQPSGQGWFGRMLDSLLLHLPATRAMRSRYIESRAAMHLAFRDFASSASAQPFRILTVPCGIPRDVLDFANDLAVENRSALPLVNYTGIDIDPEVITAAGHFLSSSSALSVQLRVGDALAPSTYTGESFDFISSTGLGEFLSNADIATFYSNVFSALAPGGIFFTSATRYDASSDSMLRAFELQTHYRTAEEIRRLLSAHPWDSIDITLDSTGLQTFVRARKFQDHEVQTISRS